MKDERNPLLRHSVGWYRIPELLEDAGIALPAGWAPYHPDGGDLIHIDTWVRNERGIEIGHDTTVDQEDIWDRMHWNPPLLFGGQLGATDDAASAKPTWEELLVVVRRYQLSRRAASESRNGSVSNRLSRTADWFSGQRLIHQASPTGIHPGTGLEHMPALIYSAARSGDAGTIHPRAIMRDPSDKTVEMWTEAEQHELLEALAYRTNLVESARNIIHQRVYMDVVIYIDETKPEDERQDALSRTIAALEVNTLEATFKAEMAKLAAHDGLPSDLGRARAVLLERLEDVATGQVKDILHAVSQQGVDLPASCLDQQTALTELAGEKQKAQIALVLASTIDDMKAAYVTGGRAMKAVQALRVPKFTVNGADAGVSYESNSSTATLVAVQSSADVAGDLAITHMEVAGVRVSLGNGYTVTRGGVSATTRTVEAGKHEAALVNAGDKDVPVILTARNVCGPARVTVVLKGKRTVVKPVP